MNNQRYNRGTRRIGAKKQDVAGRARMGLIITGAVWLLYLADELLVAHNPWWLVLIFTAGIWSVGLVISKPGKFSKKAYENGFWWSLFHPNATSRRGYRGRGRGRNYRR